MKSYVYLSSATGKFDESQLTTLIDISSKNNQALGVTGMLLYADRCFIQVIEGPTEAVEPLFKKIERDDRHTGLIKVAEEKIETPNFPQWSMGSLLLNPKIAHHRVTFELSRQALKNEIPDSASIIIKILMETFYNSSTRNLSD